MRGLLTSHGRFARWMPVPRSFGGYVMAIVGRLRDLAPYALMELILPGGSLMAVLLWLYRRQKKAPGFATHEILSLL
jgi:hypothetical protein